MTAIKYLVTYSNGTTQTVLTLDEATKAKRAGAKYHIVCEPIATHAPYNKKRMNFIRAKQAVTVV